ncbi:MAG: AAA family ATPase [Chloroflexi bacterium]|nr:AAA family ATPase [Chloroflexota bacterium]
MMQVESVAKIRILVLDDDPDPQAPLSAMLARQHGFDVTATTTPFGEAGGAVKRLQPDLAVVADVAGDPVALIEELDEAAPGLPIVVALRAERQDLARACILAGARAYVLRDGDDQDLVLTVRQVFGRENKRRKQAAVASGQRLGRIITVHGAKGGVGASTICVNLAVAVRSSTRKRVALVDGNLLGADQGVLLNIISENSIGDLVPHIKSLDGELVQAAMVHHPSGLEVLLAPDQLERAEAITGEELQRILGTMRTLFDYIIVDTSPFLDQTTLVALDLADTIVLICPPELAALKNAARFLRLAQEFGYPKEKIKLVVNRAKGPGAVSISDIEENLRTKVALRLPSDGPAVMYALNHGEPLVQVKPRSKVAQGIKRLARAIVFDQGWETLPAQSRSFLPRLALPGKRSTAIAS